MCDKDYRFRIGQVPLFYTGNKNNGHGINPWRTKMRNEGCEKIWILKICDTVHEASVEEARYIDYIYKNLNTKKTAEQCLKEFKLDIKYPLLDLSIDWMSKGHFATNATVEIYASNLIAGYMSCVCYESNTSHSNKHYEIIKQVKKQFINDPIDVYSLETESGTYVADNIVTHNSIYSFKGADPELFDKLIADPGVSVYSLNENYRNGDKILKFAKKVLGKKNSVDDSIPMRQGGTVWEGDATLSNLKNWIKETGEYKDWAVLCTTNKIIQEVCGLLEANGIPTITFKQGEVTKDQLESNMNSNKVKVLTYHSAKGLEFPYVAAWKPKNWGGDETDRVNYVGATRAKDVLLWMKEKKKSKWF